MGGRYGGKTLHEMKIEMEEETVNSGSNSSLNETSEEPSWQQPVPAAAAPPPPAGVPNMQNLAAVLAGLRPNGVGNKSPSSSFKKKKATIPPPPTASKPRQEKKTVPQPPLTHTKPQRHASAASSSRPAYANYMVQQQLQLQQQQQAERERSPEFDEEEEEETEEEYVVPSTLLREEDDNIYQNYNYSEQTEETDRGGANYVNLQVGQQQQHDSDNLYANITYDGGSKPKPIPPPRDVRRLRGGPRKM